MSESSRRRGRGSDLSATEGKEVVVEEVATMIGLRTDTHVLLHDDPAVIGTGLLGRGRSRTRMFLVGHTEGVDLPGLGPAQILAPYLRRAHHPVEPAMSAGTGRGGGVGVRPAPPRHRIEAATEKLRDAAVQTTVIEKDPFPAMIRRAHLLPDETDGDDDPFPRAVCRHQPPIEVVEAGVTLPFQDRDRGPDPWFPRVPEAGHQLTETTDAENRHLTIQEPLEDVRRLILERAVAPEITAV